MAAGRALVDALGQRPHLRHPGSDLLAEQHPAAARLGPLAHHHLDGVSRPQMVGVHAVARRQVLVHERRGVLALLLRHAPVARGGGRARGRCAPAEGLLGLGRQRAEAHPGDGDGDLEAHRALGPALADHHVGAARLPVALQGVARHRRSEEHQVVEGGEAALGPPAPDPVDAGVGRPTDLRDDVAVEGVGLPQVPEVGIRRHNGLGGVGRCEARWRLGPVGRCEARWRLGPVGRCEARWRLGPIGRCEARWRGDGVGRRRRHRLAVSFAASRASTSSMVKL